MSLIGPYVRLQWTCEILAPLESVQSHQQGTNEPTLVAVAEGA